MAAAITTTHGRRLSGPAVLHLLAPAPFGGLESVVLELAAVQRAAGIDARCALLLLPGEAPAIESALRAAGVPVLRIETYARAYRFERGAVREVLAHLLPDLVHSHGYRPVVLHVPVARALGVATVTTLHGFTGGDLKNRLFEWLQVRAARRTGCVIAVSTAIADRVRTAGVRPDRLRVIPNARRAAPPLSRDEARRRLGLADATPVVGWIGRLSREKGPDVMLDALAHLAASAPVVVFVGDGPERERLAARAAALGVSDRVRLVGAIDHAAALMPAFDAFVLSSRTEGLPMVLFEAIQAGTAVVATRVGGVPDLLGDEGGLLVPPEQPDALAAAIARVLENPEQARARAVHAARRVAELFGVEEWIRRHEEAYAVARRVRDGKA